MPFDRADITDAAQVAAVVNRVRTRYVVHQAAQVSVSTSVANVYGPRQSPHGEAGVVAIF